MYDVRCYQSFGPHIQSAAFAQAVTGMNVVAYVCAIALPCPLILIGLLAV